MNIHQILRIIFSLVLLAGCKSDKPNYAINFDGDSAYSYLIAQCNFGPRNPGSEGHKKAKEYFVSELKKFTDTVKEQTFTFSDTLVDTTYLLTNIIASFLPDNPQRVLLCAHWDTRPRADKDTDSNNRSKPIIGANDGASGVAVLLELARILKQNPPKIGVDIVLFDGEDYGEAGNESYYFIGSRYFANNLNGYSPQYGILLDMIGDRDLQIPKEGYSNLYVPEIVDKVWRIGMRKKQTPFKNTVENFIRDDHLMLISAGIKCIDIIDFDYPYWHTIEDTPDKCSPQSLKIIGDVLVELIYK